MLFIDDLSMPFPEKYGGQPPIELLRQWIDHNHWYDLQTMSRIDILDMVISLFNTVNFKCILNYYICFKFSYLSVCFNRPAEVQTVSQLVSLDT